MVWPRPYETGVSAGEEGRDYIGRRGEEEGPTEDDVGGAVEVRFEGPKSYRGHDSR
ncbi:hypothetical protein OROHE_008198 [Orobanche hederae]